MRERTVTRTVTQTTAKVMCLNVTTAEVTINEYTIGGTYTEVDLLKKRKKLYETDEFKSRRGFYPLCNRLTTKESTG